METAIVATSMIFLLLGVFIVLFIFFHKMKQRKNSEEKIRMLSVFQQEILKTQLEIQEQTLKNISQEIHDNIGQALTLAKLNMNAMLPVVDEQLKENVINSKELVSKAIADLRDLSRSLDTDYVKEMGVHRAIEYELELLRKTGAIETQLYVEGTAVKPDKQKELILFRIVQETITNIVKHAGATNLQVNIYYQPAVLELLIADNGKGMDLAPLNEGNTGFGLGIRNMHNRAKLIGADFSMNSTLGKGTTVKIVLPVENDHQGANRK